MAKAKKARLAAEAWKRVFTFFMQTRSQRDSVLARLALTPKDVGGFARLFARQAEETQIIPRPQLGTSGAHPIANGSSESSAGERENRRPDHDDPEPCNERLVD